MTDATADRGFTMASEVYFLNLSFAQSREYCGLDLGDETQQRFDRLVESAWDLGIVGVSAYELDELVNEVGFDTRSEIGKAVARMTATMYDRSFSLHSRNKGE